MAELQTWGHTLEVGGGGEREKEVKEEGKKEVEQKEE